MKEKELRARFDIPAIYHYDGKIRGKSCFSFCDSIIMVGYQSKEASQMTALETHLGLNCDATSHEFITSSWPE